MTFMHTHVLRNAKRALLHECLTQAYDSPRRLLSKKDDSTSQSFFIELGAANSENRDTWLFTRCGNYRTLNHSRC